MTNKQILPLLRQKIGVVILAGVLVAALAFLFIVISQKNFKVSSEYLVYQNQAGAQDFYSLSKSAEYIGRVLGEAARSELFIDEVIKTGKIGGEFLPFDKKEKIEEWNKTVQISNNFQLGILRIEVLANDQREAVAISEAVAEVLINKNNLFRGEGQNIGVRILSGPILEKNPSFSDIILLAIGGFLTGLIISIIWIIYRPENILTGFAANNKKDFYAGNFPEPDEYEESLKYVDR